MGGESVCVSWRCKQNCQQALRDEVVTGRYQKWTASKKKISKNVSSAHGGLQSSVTSGEKFLADSECELHCSSSPTYSHLQVITKKQNNFGGKMGKVFFFLFLLFLTSNSFMLMKTQGVDGHVWFCVIVLHRRAALYIYISERGSEKWKRNFFFFSGLCNDSEVARLQCTVPGCQSLKWLILSTWKILLIAAKETQQQELTRQCQPAWLWKWSRLCWCL